MDFDISKYTGLESGFEYIVLQSFFSEEEIKAYCNKVRNRYLKILANYDERLNSEWVIRNYMSVKLVLSSTLMLTSLRYSEEKNLQIVEPYLIYYALHNCCRSLLFTIPDEKWNDGKLVRSTHNKSINVAVDTISAISPEVGLHIKNLLENARNYRELFSYRFPANGIRIKDREGVEEYETYCRLMCEISQMHSEILHVILDVNITTDMELDFDEFVDFLNNEYTYIDDEDLYRLGYITRKIKRPLNLYWIITDGLIEDFFGAWYPNDDYESDNIDELELYNPDRKWNLLFSPL